MPLPFEARVIRTDNEDSFQGPLTRMLKEQIDDAS